MNKIIFTLNIYIIYVIRNNNIKIIMVRKNNIKVYMVLDFELNHIKYKSTHFMLFFTF